MRKHLVDVVGERRWATEWSKLKYTGKVSHFDFVGSIKKINTLASSKEYVSLQDYREFVLY
jgi:hypothetical protein